MKDAADTLTAEIADLVGPMPSDGAPPPDSAQALPDSEEFSQPAKRGPGRPKGARNKWRAPDLESRAAEIEDTGVRAVIFEAFRQLGGIPGLVAWGQKNPANFYRLFANCGPKFKPAPAGRRVREGDAEVGATVTDFTAQPGETDEQPEA